MPLEMLYRFARHARFVDGADEVHREMVARHVLRDYSAPADGVPSDHIEKRREAALRKFGDVFAPAAVD
jgi:acyl-CoA dehydrogenase